MISIEKSLFPRWFQPDFMFGVFGDKVQGSDIQAKTTGFGEFPKTNPDSEKLKKWLKWRKF